jgi:hypothetical protein
MNQGIILDQQNGVERTIRKKACNRRPLAPLGAREWMTVNETALALGCSGSPLLTVPVKQAVFRGSKIDASTACRRFGIDFRPQGPTYTSVRALPDASKKASEDAAHAALYVQWEPSKRLGRSR